MYTRMCMRTYMHRIRRHARRETATEDREQTETVVRRETATEDREQTETVVR